jgi:hypothetical protein
LYYSVEIDSDDSIFNIDMNSHTSDSVDNNGNYMHIKNKEEMKNHHRCIFENKIDQNLAELLLKSYRFLQQSIAFRDNATNIDLSNSRI